MTKKASRGATGENRPPVVLIFGESENDRGGLRELFKALRPDLANISVRTMREPLILMKDDQKRTTRRKTTDRIAAIVRVAQLSKTVSAVIAHQDCDAVEPAHQTLADTIESELKAAGVPNPIAATPAWEIEAWWMLFPAAVRATRPCWAPINYASRHIGGIPDVKEVLRRDLRPIEPRFRGNCPDYTESDGIKIALNIRGLKLQDKPLGRSDSFTHFTSKIRSLLITT